MPLQRLLTAYVTTMTASLCSPLTLMNAFKKYIIYSSQASAYRWQKI
jgi:hypothetical protein